MQIDGFSIVFFAAAIPLVLAVVAYGIVQNQKRTEAWHALARQSGLSSSGSWPTMSMNGELAGSTVHLRQWTTRSSGKNSHTHYHVRAEAGVRRNFGDLVVYQQTWMSSIGAAVFGMQDLEVGEPDFDGKFVVKASDPDLARRLLDPATRRALQDTFGMLGDVGIEGNCVVYQASTSISPERAIEILLGLSTCAATLADG